MEIFTVGQINGYIKTLLESDTLLSEVTIIGEISNFKNHSSGHMYFSLKDEYGSINAAMFRFQNKSLRFIPENGMRVLAKGKISLYVPTGQYQIIVESLEPDGVGELYFAFERLKERLAGEGLFDTRHKKALPLYPKTIGVVTSKTGAALRDIFSVLSRRWPYAELLLCGASVQGSGAAQEIVRGIHTLDDCCDVMIVGRGGGSVEDLWCFNDERVARAIFACKTPVISAVGHEIDFTISDFVADVRAATPSAAAELVAPDSAELMLHARSLLKRCAGAVAQKNERARIRLAALLEKKALSEPMYYVTRRSELLSVLSKRIDEGFKNGLSSKNARLKAAADRLVALNPLAVLSRGYSVVMMGDRAVRKACELHKDDIVSIRLSEGSAQCIVTDTEAKTKDE